VAKTRFRLLQSTFSSQLMASFPEDKQCGCKNHGIIPKNQRGMEAESWKALLGAGFGP
jgi:hypothetical protein